MKKYKLKICSINIVKKISFISYIVLFCLHLHISIILLYTFYNHDISININIIHSNELSIIYLCTYHICLNSIYYFV